MHPNAAFRGAPDAEALALVRARGFGLLSVNGEDGPLLSHVPVLLSEDGAALDFHLVRSNPIARLDGVAAVVAVSGPDGYVSPDWYGVPDQVPTWNYVAVHLRGTLRRLPDAALRDLLDRQSAKAEARLLPKPPWTADKMDPDALDRMLRQIVPYRLTDLATASTFKLSQNKPDAVRLATAEKLAAAEIGREAAALAAMMRDAD